MNKQLLAIFLVVTVKGLSQDTSRSLGPLHKGFYFTVKEFISNTPSNKEPFSIITRYSTRLVKDSNYEETHRKHLDTTDVAYDYQLLADSLARVNYVWGFCDGRYRYFKKPWTSIPDEQLFYRVESRGKYPIILIRREKDNFFISTNPLLFLGGLAVSAATKKRFPPEELLYFDTKGELCPHTSQSIAYLLRNDADLLDEFKKEQGPNKVVFIKYLVKLNDRYHYAGYSLEEHQ